MGVLGGRSWLMDGIQSRIPQHREQQSRKQGRRKRLVMSDDTRQNCSLFQNIAIFGRGGVGRRGVGRWSRLRVGIQSSTPQCRLASAEQEKDRDKRQKISLFLKIAEVILLTRPVGSHVCCCCCFTQLKRSPVNLLNE